MLGQFYMYHAWGPTKSEHYNQFLSMKEVRAARMEFTISIYFSDVVSQHQTYRRSREFISAGSWYSGQSKSRPSTQAQALCRP